MLVTYGIHLNRTPSFAWCVWLGMELGTDTKTTSSSALKEIGLRVRNLLVILGSIVNIIVGSCLIVLQEREYLV